MNDTPHVRFEDQSSTETQGFEKASNSVLYVNEGFCSKCFKPFNSPDRKSYRINVITNTKQDVWCAQCEEEGTASGICIQESKLTKEERKLWQKKFKV
jgi:hypothetical protein